MRLEDHLRVIKFNTVDLLPEEELVEKLKTGRPLRIKYGADPSRPDLHLVIMFA
jgi:tyrosyl-tRNA synthetase (EC 6.1.1.1)